MVASCRGVSLVGGKGGEAGQEEQQVGGGLLPNWRDFLKRCSWLLHHVEGMSLREPLRFPTASEGAREGDALVVIPALLGRST